MHLPNLKNLTFSRPIFTQLPTHLFTIFDEKAPNFAQIGCFFCLWWNPTNRHTKFCEKAPQKSGTYTYRYIYHVNVRTSFPQYKILQAVSRSTVPVWGICKSPITECLSSIEMHRPKCNHGGLKEIADGCCSILPQSSMGSRMLILRTVYFLTHTLPTLMFGRLFLHHYIIL